MEFLTKYRAEAIEVSIFEYDEETHMRQVREEGWEDGLEKGRAEGLSEGRTEGEWMKLVSQVQKKLAKGLNAAVIAEMLEEPEPLMEELIRLIETNPEKTAQELGKLYAGEQRKVQA